MEKGIIKLRGHHLLALWDYITNKPTLEELIKYQKSQGYSEDFSINEFNIFKRILENKSLLIKIINDFDELCSCCNKKEESCNSNSKIVKKAEKYMLNDKYDLKLNKTYSAETIVKLVMEK